jgi:hypothetical protein
MLNSNYFKFKFQYYFTLHLRPTSFQSIYFLTCELKPSLPLNYLLILKSYLQNRHFSVKTENEYTELSLINSGVSQGSAFGSLLYLLLTADIPLSPETTSATFADNTAVTAIASSKLQTNILAIQSWLAKWRMKAMELSQHTSHSPREEERVPRFTSTMSNFLKQKRSSI